MWVTYHFVINFVEVNFTNFIYDIFALERDESESWKGKERRSKDQFIRKLGLLNNITIIIAIILWHFNRCLSSKTLCLWQSILIRNELVLDQVKPGPDHEWGSISVAINHVEFLLANFTLTKELVGVSFALVIYLDFRQLLFWPFSFPTLSQLTVPLCFVVELTKDA